jgi:phosphoribosyl 1,2-cyclic phosphodiesterase
VRVISLGSGSSGNALLVQSGETFVLVDAGFPARLLAGRLRSVGVAPASLSAMLLTHEHGDHACGALSLACQYEIPIVSDPRTVDALLKQPSREARPAGWAPERVELPVGRSARVGTLEIRSFAISHDAVAPCGFTLATSAWRVGVMTDTGMVGPQAVEALRGAHLLVIEANHDKARLLDGPYPWYLKQRILSPTGHLSNEQTGEALAQMLDDGPCWLWLAHLSRTNNTPDLARAQVSELLRSRGLKHIKPTPLPREIGPVWDTASLWGVAQPAPADTREGVAAARSSAKEDAFAASDVSSAT